MQVLGYKFAQKLLPERGETGELMFIDWIRMCQSVDCRSFNELNVDG